MGTDQAILLFKNIYDPGAKEELLFIEYLVSNPNLYQSDLNLRNQVKRAGTFLLQQAEEVVCREGKERVGDIIESCG